MNLERNNYGYNTIKKNSRRPGRDLETGEEGPRKDGAHQPKRKICFIRAGPK